MKEKQLQTLWERFIQDLANVYDVHGVCATIAAETAQFVQTPCLVALLETSGRYYDVWIGQKNGDVDQTRWPIDQSHFDNLVAYPQIKRHEKYNQPPSAIVNGEIWRLAHDNLLVAPLPYPTRPDGIFPQGVLCLIDAPLEHCLNEASLPATAKLMTTYLERAALLNLTARQRIEFSVISDISHSLASTLRLEEIFQRVAGDIRRMLNTESLSIALMDAVTGNIVFFPELMGVLFSDIPPIQLRPGEGIAGWVAQTGQPLVINDVYSDKRFYRKSDTLSGFQTHSILCVPLKANEQMIGVMEAINKLDGEFTEHDQAILEALSGPISAAIVNARLHQDVVSEKRRIETIVQSMSEGMLTIAPSGHITAVNDALLTILRKTRPEVEGQPLQKVITLKEGQFYDFFLEVMRSKPTTDFPQLACEIRQLDSYVPVLTSGAVITQKEGEVSEVILAFSDLRQIRELERMRDDFFHSIVHELRTPLALILMYARLLLNGRAKDDPEKEERFLKVIERESDRLQMMVRQMLQLAKLEAKEIQRSAELISLNDVLDEMVPPLADKATEKGLTFMQKIKPDLPKIIADRETIYMIFKNLIENAIKFTLNGTVRVDARLEGRKIVVEVSDEGIGIPEAALPNLFKRFYRTSTAVERGIAGTGIGLSLVKEGVEKHKGEIVVQSDIGKGTKFTVQLPVAD